MRMHSQDEFQSWLANDLEVRDELYAMIGNDLDPDPASLDVLEAFLLERYPTPDAALTLAERNILDAAARHIGLVLMLSVDGATWSINLDDRDAAYYRLPLIVFADGTSACPLAMATAALDRRTGSFLRGIAQVYEDEANG